MSISVDHLITKQDIINRFHERIRTLAAANVNLLPSRVFQNSVRVWNGTPGNQHIGSTHPAHTQAYTVVQTLNTTAGEIAENSSNYGGSPNATLNAGPTESIGVDDINDAVSANPNTAGDMANTLREFLKVYARVHYARFQNTGNLEPMITEGVVSSSNLPAATADLINTDVRDALRTHGIEDGGLIEASKFLQFIESCRNIWTNRCLNSGPVETFKFYYCHNSCHSNVTCYNSRGRR